jgi:internalin A
LRKLPKWYGLLTNLTALDLSHNELISLPDSMRGLVNLEELNLSDNLVYLHRTSADYGYMTLALPDWLGELTSLRKLEATDAIRGPLPDSMRQLGNLESLALSRIDFRSSSGDAAHPDSFESARGAGRRTLPDSFRGLGALRSLRIVDSGLDELPEWFGDQYPDLESLDLSMNNISSLPDSVRKLAKLSALKLRCNKISSLPEWIDSLKCLTVLDLDLNQITSLPETIGELKNLTTLDLSRNKGLTELPHQLGSLTSLKALVLNPPLELTSPPPEIVAQGTQQTLAFLRARQRSTEEQWTAKLILVGQGGVGKTSVVKALSGQPHDPGEPVTHGMRVVNLPLAHPDQQAVVINLAAWDFGGQEVYHATHQFFLTDRAVFLLVINGRAENGANRLRHWLDIITARAPKAPILVVATHAAQGASHVNLAELQAEFPQVAAVHAVDCSTSAGIAALRGAVASQAAQLPTMGTPWPRQWTAAGEALAKERAPIITARRMRAIMARVSVADQVEQDALADVLHQRGQILRYADAPDLADTVVLDAQWLNQHISALFDHPGPVSHGGVVYESDLAALWSDLDLAERRFLLAAMHRFDLSYPVRDAADDAVAILVGRLPDTPAPYAEPWNAALQGQHRTEIRIQYRLPFLPPGIPGWFIARAHRFATPARWRTGALLAHPDGLHFALLRADPASCTIELAARGPLPAVFFAVLDDGLNLTLDRYPGLAVVREVPCHGHNGKSCTNVFKYTELTSALASGRREVRCDVAHIATDTAELLLGISPTMRDLAARDIQDQLTALLEQNRETQQAVAKAVTVIRRSQQAHCPSVFTITPARTRTPGKSRYTLRLYCEEPGHWHPLPGDAGCYQITDIADWLRKFRPFLQRTLRLLAAVTPVVGSLLGMAADELHGQLITDLEQANQLLALIPGDIAALENPVSGIDNTASPNPLKRATSDADFRELRASLLTLDPAERWGGLSYTPTPEGLSLYLCREHQTAYDIRQLS